MCMSHFKHQLKEEEKHNDQAHTRTHTLEKLYDVIPLFKQN